MPETAPPPTPSTSGWPPDERSSGVPRGPAGASAVALPVELALHGRRGDAIRRWVEGTLGWQPVDAETARLVPPAVVLRDLDTIPSVSSERGTPVILVVDDDTPAGAAASGAAAMAPDAVVAWPSGRDRLVGLVEDELGRPRPLRRVVRTLRVGGSAGGVGTTTITFALAGLSAWRGTATLAAVRGAGIAARPVPAAALAAADVWSRADPVAGVPDCRAVRIVDGDPVPAPTDRAIGSVVVDLGVDADADVLVCRPDAAGLEVVAATTAGAIVVVGTGPVSLRDLGRAASGRRAVTMPWSARVARAAVDGRLPAGLPGAWLRRLAPLVPAARDPED